MRHRGRRLARGRRARRRGRGRRPRRRAAGRPVGPAGAQPRHRRTPSKPALHLLLSWRAVGAAPPCGASATSLRASCRCLQLWRPTTTPTFSALLETARQGLTCSDSATSRHNRAGQGRPLKRGWPARACATAPGHGGGGRCSGARRAARALERSRGAGGCQALVRRQHPARAPPGSSWARSCDEVACTQGAPGPLASHRPSGGRMCMAETERAQAAQASMCLAEPLGDSPSAGARGVTAAGTRTQGAGRSTGRRAPGRTAASAPAAGPGAAARAAPTAPPGPPPAARPPAPAARRPRRRTRRLPARPPWPRPVRRARAAGAARTRRPPPPAAQTSAPAALRARRDRMVSRAAGVRRQGRSVSSNKANPGVKSE